MKTESETELDDFAKWLERGWWTTSEAFCIFMGYSPAEAEYEASYKILQHSEKGRHIFNLTSSAESDGSIKELVLVNEHAPWMGYRAPCKVWLEWAMKKSSISLDLNLLKIAGIDADKIARTNDSYRPEEEKIRKISFLSIARVAIHLCPKARLKDIIKLALSSGGLDKKPSDKTLRNWLGEARVVLYASKISADEADAIEKKLAPLLLAKENPKSTSPA